MVVGVHVDVTGLWSAPDGCPATRVLIDDVFWRDLWGG